VDAAGHHAPDPSWLTRIELAGMPVSATVWNWAFYANFANSRELNLRQSV